MCYVTLAGYATTLPSTMVYIAIVMPWAAAAAAAAAAADVADCCFGMAIACYW